MVSMAGTAWVLVAMLWMQASFPEWAVENGYRHAVGATVLAVVMQGLSIWCSRVRKPQVGV